MKKEIADKWVADLRSGPKQGKNALGDDEKGYCCLGRLCVVLNMDFMPVSAFLSEEHMIAAGMSSTMGNFGSPFDLYQDHLASVNDSGLTFDQIADLIEYFWEEL
jgi:hypothetical protein